MSSFQLTGKTITFTADSTPPTPVQILSDDKEISVDVLVVNVGNVTAFIAWGPTASQATQRAVVPTGTTQFCTPVLTVSSRVLTIPSGSYMTGVSASTCIVYASPGYEKQ